MSALPKIPKGYCIIAFELHPKEGLIYLGLVKGNNKTGKVPVRSAVLPKRKTRGDTRLLMHLAHDNPIEIEIIKNGYFDMYDKFKSNHPLLFTVKHSYSLENVNVVHPIIKL